MQAYYFDHNATTRVDERVIEAMLPYLHHSYGNPSASHRFGLVVRNAINQAREQVASLVNAQADQVIFTSGGTEANNIALHGVMTANPEMALAVSDIEHASVAAVASYWKRQKRTVDIISVDDQGRVRNDSVKALLQKMLSQQKATRSISPSILLSIMMANNETGVIQEFDTVGTMLATDQVVLHTDAVQAAGKEKIDFNTLGVDLMSLSGHKIYAPKGVGALVVNKKLTLNPVYFGGAQESAKRPGTENVPGIVAFGVAAEIAQIELQQRQAHYRALQQYFEGQLLSLLSQVVIFSKETSRLANTVMFAIPGIDGETLLINLDNKAIAVSSGSACESGSSEPSHVLLAMGVEKSLARSALRISFGIDNTKHEIDVLVAELKQQVDNIKNMAAILSG